MTLQYLNKNVVEWKTNTNNSVSKIIMLYFRFDTVN